MVTSTSIQKKRIWYMAPVVLRLILFAFCMTWYNRYVFADKQPYCNTHPMAYKKGAKAQPVDAKYVSSPVPACMLSATTVAEENIAPKQSSNKNSSWPTLTTASSRFRTSQMMKNRLKDHEIATKIYAMASIHVGSRLSSRYTQYSLVESPIVVLSSGHTSHCLLRDGDLAKVSKGHSLQVFSRIPPCNSMRVSLTKLPTSQSKAFNDGITVWASACKRGLTKAFRNELSSFRGCHCEAAASRPLFLWNLLNRTGPNRVSVFSTVNSRRKNSRVSSF
mmetsp:Transcript_32988/g.79785  ORF Transcript_32988/g.79785 Transcript_32988/m.79785 type:complete len:277 (-) Transcript_32988:110-940(-)